MLCSYTLWNISEETFFQAFDVVKKCYILQKWVKKQAS